eukprot:m.120610 g.120610  ORF g.120610 m.120610 type:complete len:218 (+) comp52086_c0_seq4:86-739(+)
MDYDDEYEPDGYEDDGPADYASAGLSACSNCGRNFNHTSLAKHENICRKLAVKAKKRGVFDASKKRIQAIGLNPTAVAVSQEKNDQALAKAEAKTAQWRAKHEQFVKTIREARKVQNILAAGGSLADLPPPPRDEHPEYVQCPHCSRRFDETVAQRHIPFCATQVSLSSLVCERHHLREPGETPSAKAADCRRHLYDPETNRIPSSIARSANTVPRG